MNAFTIVTVIRALLNDGQTDEQIAQTLQSMGFDNDDTNGTDDADQTDGAADETDENPADRDIVGGIAPSVTYKLAPGMTLQRMQRTMNGRKLQVGSLIAKHQRTGITKRDIKNTLKITKGAAMSAIHALQTAGAVISVPIPGAPPNPLARANRAKQAPRRAVKRQTASAAKRPVGRPRANAAPRSVRASR